MLEDGDWKPTTSRVTRLNPKGLSAESMIIRRSKSSSWHKSPSWYIPVSTKMNGYPPESIPNRSCILGWVLEHRISKEGKKETNKQYTHMANTKITNETPLSPIQKIKLQNSLDLLYLLLPPTRQDLTQG